MITYTPFFTISLILVERVRGNEPSIIGRKLIFHILPPKCLSSR